MAQGRLNKLYMAEYGSESYGWFLGQTCGQYALDAIPKRLSNLWDMRSWLWLLCVPVVLLLTPLLAYSDMKRGQENAKLRPENFYPNFNYYYRKPELFRTEENELLLKGLVK